MPNATSATRALAVLRALASSPGPMPASTLARQLGMPRSSMYHLLAAMQSAGFVAHYPEDERWGLGVGAFEIGAAYLRHEPLERFGRPVLHRLAHDIVDVA
ncbi:MAG: helix-turn-helix domain-containing protein, partial [bacterium]|nr:helix-turn-helix domain-containing protein [bacterium]